MGLTWYDPRPPPRPHSLTPTCALIRALTRPRPRPILCPCALTSPAPGFFWSSVQLHKVQLTAFQSVPSAAGGYVGRYDRAPPDETDTRDFGL